MKRGLWRRALMWILSFVPDEPPPLRPERFGDPLALKVEWTPLVSGGTSFCAQRLVQVTATRWEFRVSLESRLFVGFFACFCAGGSALLAVLPSPDGRSATPRVAAAALMGVAMVAVAAWLYRWLRRPRVFDLARGSYVNAEGDVFALAEVRAIQLVNERVGTRRKDRFVSVELNLVTSDAARISVVDHGDRSQIQSDAAILAQILGVPVWDATDAPPQRFTER